LRRIPHAEGARRRLHVDLLAGAVLVPGYATSGKLGKSSAYNGMPNIMKAATEATIITDRPRTQAVLMERSSPADYVA